MPRKTSVVGRPANRRICRLGVLLLAAPIFVVGNASLAGSHVSPTNADVVQVNVAPVPVP